MEYYNYDCPCVWRSTQCPNRCWQAYKRDVAINKEIYCTCIVRIGN